MIRKKDLENRIIELENEVGALSDWAMVIDIYLKKLVDEKLTKKNNK